MIIMGKIRIDPIISYLRVTKRKVTPNELQRALKIPFCIATIKKNLIGHPEIKHGYISVRGKTESIAFWYKDYDFDDNQDLML